MKEMIHKSMNQRERVCNTNGVYTPATNFHNDYDVSQRNEYSPTLTENVKQINKQSFKSSYE